MGGEKGRGERGRGCDNRKGGDVTLRISEREKGRKERKMEEGIKGEERGREKAGEKRKMEEERRL